MSIPFKDLVSPEKVYTFVDPSTQQLIHFAVDRMLKSIQVKLVPECIINLSHETGTELLSSGINADKLRRMMMYKFADPILLIRYPDGKDVLVDGVYRYCASLARGEKEIRARRVPMSLASKFVVTDVPHTREQLDRLAKATKQIGSIH